MRENTDQKTPNTDTFHAVNSSQKETTSPTLCIFSLLVAIHSCRSVEEKDTLLATQDEEIPSILEEELLEGTTNLCAINNSKLSGYFYLDTIFNLSGRVLTEIEKKIEKGFWLCSYAK